MAKRTPSDYYTIHYLDDYGDRRIKLCNTHSGLTDTLHELREYGNTPLYYSHTLHYPA